MESQISLTIFTPKVLETFSIYHAAAAKTGDREERKRRWEKADMEREGKATTLLSDNPPDS